MYCNCLFQAGSSKREAFQELNLENIEKEINVEEPNETFDATESPEDRYENEVVDYLQTINKIYHNSRDQK